MMGITQYIISPCDNSSLHDKLPWINLSSQDKSLINYLAINVGRFVYAIKQPNLKLKTQPKQLLGFLMLALCAPRRYVNEVVNCI